MRNLNFVLRCCVLIVICTQPLFAQESKVHVQFFDARTKSLVANVQLVNDGQVVTRDESDGSYKLPVDLKRVTASALGYYPVEVDVTKQSQTINLVPVNEAAEVTGLWGYEKDRHLSTMATSSVTGGLTENIGLAHKINGLLSGYGGGNIRGSHTFNGSNNPIVLVDGRQQSIIDPYDIESVTILKDASATALYGLNSGQGVVLITTKQGKEGPVKINFQSKGSVRIPQRLPKILGAADYANLYNEAYLNDGGNPSNPPYSQPDILAYKNQTDPYRYPDVRWDKEFLREQIFGTGYELNVSGGTKAARYYVSAIYDVSGGQYNINDTLNTYNTNTRSQTMGVHGKTSVNIGQNLVVTGDIVGTMQKDNRPGGNNIISDIYTTPSNAMPVLYKNGLVAAKAGYSSIYGKLNSAGYRINEASTIAASLDFVYDFSNHLKGLKLKGQVSIFNSTVFDINRSKSFATYFLKDGVSGDALSDYIVNGTDGTVAQAGNYQSIDRIFEDNLALSYTRSLGKHNIDASAIYSLRQLESQSNQTNIARVARTYQGPRGYISYHYDKRYLLDLVASYEGSEQYPKEGRYAFSPAISGGWVLSNETFMNSIKNAVNLLKFRGSYGVTAIDPTLPYFGYLETYGSSRTVRFGANTQLFTEFYQLQTPNNAITWNKLNKGNVGLDFTLFNNSISGSVDYFNENNKDIMVDDIMPGIFGTSISYPVGKFKNSGTEFNLSWNKNINSFHIYLSGNVTFAKSKIIYQVEVQEYPWMYETGSPYGAFKGYVFDRYFTEDDDFLSLPDQTAVGGNATRPGDLKYKDLNDDGIIDQRDRTVLGNPRLPEIHYGFISAFSYKNFDLSMVFEGTGRSSYMNTDQVYRAFNNSGTGNAMAHHLGRWQPNSGQEASYPRLTLTNANNYAASSYWLLDNSYFRLGSAEFGYSLPQKLSRLISLQGLRFFVSGQNLFVVDKIKFKDPLTSNMISTLDKVVSVGLNVKF